MDRVQLTTTLDNDILSTLIYRRNPSSAPTHTHSLTQPHIYIWLICQPFASLYFPFYFTQKKAATKNEPTMVVQIDRLYIHSD